MCVALVVTRTRRNSCTTLPLTLPPTHPHPVQQLEEDLRVMQEEVLRNGDNGLNMPVNLKRLIENAQRKFGCRPHKRVPTGASPAAGGALDCSFWRCRGLLPMKGLGAAACPAWPLLQ